MLTPIFRTLVRATVLLAVCGAPAMACEGWYDGQRWRALHEDPDNIARLVVESANAVERGSAKPAGFPGAVKVEIQSKNVLSTESAEPNDKVAHVPVFRDQPGGPIRVAIGGVIIRFAKDVDARQQASWVADQGLVVISSPDALDWILVASEAGSASVELANRLHQLPEVQNASPNWWRPVSRR